MEWSGARLRFGLVNKGKETDGFYCVLLLRLQCGGLNAGSYTSSCDERPAHVSSVHPYSS